MASLPGYFTPSEAFAAIEAGATALKLFPAEGASPAVLKAHRAVLPKETRMLAVGGVTPTTMRPWREAGATGFGLGRTEERRVGKVCVGPGRTRWAQNHEQKKKASNDT